MLPDDRLQQILATKRHEDAKASMKEHGHQSECWHIMDGTLVIYDEFEPPPWLPKERDEDGNTPEFAAQHGAN